MVADGELRECRRSGDDGDAEAEGEGEDEGSSRFCPPRGDDSPTHTRPTRAASQSGAARGGELKGDPAEVPSSSSSAAGDDDDDPFLLARFVSARPSSEREREREEGSEEAKNMRVYCHVTCATE
uniref:Uncharacterized protein n=1 Tax=Oryza barthii TaxID=65489 RepID=A0A0D3EVR0_9ORYZ